jgi:hypothetical protein
MGMTTTYVHLDHVHQPQPSQLVPVAWAKSIADNFDFLAKVPHLQLVRFPNLLEEPTLDSDNVAPIAFQGIASHSGEFFSASAGVVESFSVPYTGLYAASCMATITYATFTSTTTSFVAMTYEDGEYLLRSAGDIAAGTFSVGGLVALSAGDVVSFSAYQDSGDKAHVAALGSLAFIGGLQ